jgi:hypothetical protein
MRPVKRNGETVPNCETLFKVDPRLEEGSPLSSSFRGIALSLTTKSGLRLVVNSHAKADPQVFP